MNKEIEIKDYCGTITWLCMDDEIEFEAQVYFHFEEEESKGNSRSCNNPRISSIKKARHIAGGLFYFHSDFKTA